MVRLRSARFDFHSNRGGVFHGDRSNSSGRATKGPSQQIARIANEIDALEFCLENHDFARENHGHDISRPAAKVRGGDAK
jgi:hypothetical protein